MSMKIFRGELSASHKTQIQSRHKTQQVNTNGRLSLSPTHSRHTPLMRLRDIIYDTLDNY
jgi:hypothetical protein